MADTIELKNLLDDVNAKKMVLPDFQRKFIWDIDDMTKMPPWGNNISECVKDFL